VNSGKNGKNNGTRQGKKREEIDGEDHAEDPLKGVDPRRSYSLLERKPERSFKSGE